MIISEINLTNLDVPSILGFGASGLIFLLTVLTYFLLRQIINHPETSKMTFYTIWMFMLLNIASVIIVGFIGVPAISKNNQLNSMNGQLQVKNTELKTVIAANAEQERVREELDAGNHLAAAEHMDKLVEKTDSLIALAPDDQKQSLMTYRKDLAMQKDVILNLKKNPQDTASIKKVSRTLNKFKAEFRAYVPK